MYNLSKAGIVAFASGAYQEIAISGMSITNADIIQGSLSINRYNANADYLEIGTAIAGELDFTLENADGRWDSTNFIGKDLTVSVKTGGYTVPLGKFTIDSATIRKTVKIVALDYMVKFDKDISQDLWNGSSYTTLRNIITRTCTRCGVSVGATSGLPNYNMRVNKFDTSRLTYRAIIRKAAEIMGTYAYIDRSGVLQFSWFKPIPTYTKAVYGQAIYGQAIYGKTTDDTDYYARKLTSAERYQSDIDTEDISITGVIMNVGDLALLSGSSDYAIEISDNPMVTGYGSTDLTTTINNIYNQVVCTYRAFTATTVSMPWVDVGDIIENDGHWSCITDWTFNLNGATALRSRGESTVRKSYANENGFTQTQWSVVLAQKEATATAQSTASTASTKADTAQTTANNAQTTADTALSTANTAQSTANGKNTVYYGSTQPTGGTYKENDLWFKYETDGSVTTYVYHNGAWVKEEFGTNAIFDLAITNAKIADATIQNGKIASLDAGKITSGYISADRINANSIAVGKLTGTVTNGDWGVDFTNGTFNIGTLTISDVTNLQTTLNGKASTSEAQGYATTAGGKAACRGVCSTEATTAAKVVTAANFVLEQGAAVTVFNTTAQTSTGAITLNVNSTGAKTVYVGGAATSSSNQLLWAANSSITFVYDGTYFRVESQPGSYIGTTCSTTAATAAKTTTVNEIVVMKGTTVEVPMTYANTNTSATLNVTSLGAKNIYYGTSSTRPTQDNGHSWIATTTAKFVFSGSVWRLGGQTFISGDSISTGIINANRIDANSITVDKLSGSIATDGWEINLTNGTMSIGNLSASKITAGTITGAVTATNLTMTGGSINMTTNSSSFDSIQINFARGDVTFSTGVSPGTVWARQWLESTGSNYRSILDAYGVSGWYDNNNAFRLYMDTNSSYPAYAYMEMRQYSTGWKKTIELDSTSGIKIYNNVVTPNITLALNGDISTLGAINCSTIVSANQVECTSTMVSHGADVVNVSDSQALTNKTYNGYTLANVCTLSYTVVSTF